jgi:sugar phosphate permease
LNSIRQIHDPARESFTRGQRTVLWVLWITYGSFYFGRNNLGVVLTEIGGELHYTKSELGTVLMVLKLAYGVGQLINGQLAERWNPRKLLALGLLASAALNVLFGMATALYMLIFIWACNGYVQALGWPPTMRTAANWFPPLQRGRAIGIIGTGYQLCGALTFVLTGWAAEKFGWRGALYVPAGILTASAVHMLLFLKDEPAGEHQFAPARTGQQGGAALFRDSLVTTLCNPRLWLAAGALFMLDTCRYGFTDWGVTHLKEVQHDSVGTAAFKYAVLPFGGILGALFSGWATDRYFHGRRAPAICGLLALLGALGLAYDSVLHWGMAASVIILICIGFCIFGSQVLLVGTLPVDLARHHHAAAAVGFVNFMGYMGAAAGDKVTGHLAQAYGWPSAVRFWAACAFAGAVIIAFLWNVGGRERGAPRENT